MQADEVAAFEQLVERHRLGVGEHDLVGADVRVGDEDARAEGAQALGHGAPDRTEADEADGLVPQLAALQAGERLAHAAHVAGVDPRLTQERRRGGQPASQHQQERNGELGDRVGVAPRGVQHRNAEGGARRDVDVHRVAAARGDDAQVGQLAQRVGVDDVHFGDEDLHAAQRLDQRRSGEQAHHFAEARVLDVAERAQRRQPRVVHVRRHQDARAQRRPARRPPRRSSP